METKTPQRRPSAEKAAAIPMNERILVNEDEAAAMVGINKWTFRRWVDADYIAPVSLPLGTRRNLYRVADLLALVADED